MMTFEDLCNITNEAVLIMMFTRTLYSLCYKTHPSHRSSSNSGSKFFWA